VRGARVLNAMRKVPRERFVPVHLAFRAYDDAPLPIGRARPSLSRTSWHT
jgi:protein-L-isoaspartate(D-aspartate) O-methyltransferase